MEMVFLAILMIGIVSSIFGVLMIFSPGLILKLERSANHLYMTDAKLMSNRIPLGIFMLIASAIFVYSYYSGPYREIVFLYLSMVAAAFGLLAPLGLLFCDSVSGNIAVVHSATSILSLTTNVF